MTIVAAVWLAFWLRRGRVRVDGINRDSQLLQFVISVIVKRGGAATPSTANGWGRQNKTKLILIYS